MFVSTIWSSEILAIEVNFRGIVYFGNMDNKKKGCVAIIMAIGSIRRVQLNRWMKEWLKKREEYSHMRLLKEIGLTDTQDIHNYFRMNEETFTKLLQMVAPLLRRQNTNMRECISVNERLALTLRYLATGRNFEDLKFSVIMSPATISEAITEMCATLVHVLRDYMKFPTTAAEWNDIANEFEIRYQFWNTVGSLDGKHVAIIKPDNSGSLYYNYKGFFSIVLLALVNAKKEFLMVDVGMNGRISDGGVMFYSKFGELFRENQLNLPAPRHLPNTTEVLPYVFVADEAFAVHTNLLKPYSQRLLNDERQVFNERLSRARVVVENAFGILSSRFGVFQKPINLQPRKATIITTACCYLHNFLAKESEQYLNSADRGYNEKNVVPLQSTLHRNSSSSAKTIRDKFCHYYNNEGKF